MPAHSYTPGRIKLFGAGAPDEADISTPCVRASRDITSVSFHENSATTYGVNSGDTGPARLANHEPVKILTLGLCMGEQAWVLLAHGGAALCRIESAAEALGRADMTVASLETKLELAEAKRALAETRLEATKASPAETEASALTHLDRAESAIVRMRNVIGGTDAGRFAAWTPAQRAFEDLAARAQNFINKARQAMIEAQEAATEVLGARPANKEEGPHAPR